MRLLLVEDDPGSRDATRTFLSDEGYEVVTAENGIDARRYFSDGVSVVISDLKMPGGGGMNLLRSVRKELPHTPVIIMTGQGSEEAAVAALKEGAFHYVKKPANPPELLSLIRQAVEKHGMATEIAALHEQMNREFGFSSMIGKSDPMRRVFEKIHMAADTRSTVMVKGESGTGKELVARALHFNSSRRRKPFMAINCAAIPEALIESELFGHLRGAFTGATERRNGKFQAAHEGTLLIDEIGEMQIELQSKLLRAIESRCITPVGSNDEIEIDVRIIASTHQDLQQLVLEGKFREDLFYRLNVITIELPPLRDRREDIPLIARTFIRDIATETQRPARDITPEALNLLKHYDWPGNVRQLRNLLESVIVMSTREVIDESDLPEPIRQEPLKQQRDFVIPAGLSMEDIEREAIRQALEQTQGNRSEASRILGVSVRTLQRKIKQFSLPL